MYWTLYAFCTLLSAVHVYCGPDDKVPCTNGEQDVMRNELIDRERCGNPRPVYVELNHTVEDEVIHPRSVWVQRCVGYCDHLGPQVKCKPNVVEFRSVPVKVINKKTLKESCAMYQVEEHPRCQTCEAVFDTRPCDPNLDNVRHEMILESQCQYAKEVFVELTHGYAHKEIFPKGVWVKRCIGLCDAAGATAKCLPNLKFTRKVPVKVVDFKTNKEYCAEYELEEHQSCQKCVAR